MAGDPCTSDQSEAWENGATDTMNPSPNQVRVACLLLSCRTQEKMVLFCLQGETHTGKVKLKCSQRLMIPQKQVLPLQQRPAPCLCAALAKAHLSGEAWIPDHALVEANKLYQGRPGGRQPAMGGGGVCEVGLHDLF